MPSIAHVSTTPLSFGTSTKMNVWGLVHSNLLTTPVIVFSCVMSNTANEWCADSWTPVTASAAITKQRSHQILICILFLDVDAGLAVLIDEVAVVLFADVFGDG